MLNFTPLTVTEVRRETADSVSVALKVPTAQLSTFQFAAGQYLTLRTHLNGEEIRRSYSLCEPPSAYARSSELRIAVKEVNGGRFSTFINRTLAAGAQIDVMPPDGRFTTPIAATHAHHYVGFAGGSGITPVLSLAATLLEAEPSSSFTLVYGNRTVASVMFIEALEDLKNRYLQRFVLHHVLSDEPQEVSLFHGLLNREKCDALLTQLIPATTIDKAFVCGPDPMMDAVEQSLLSHGVAREKILVERFGVPMPSAADAAKAAAASAPIASAGQTRLTIIADGKHRFIPLKADQSVLDAGLTAGLALPYACKGGVCCTCKAKVLQGSVEMQRNFTLTAQEQAQGFVLTCQSLCTSPEVVVSYDER